MFRWFAKQKPQPQVSAQGIIDSLFLDKETLESIKNIINAIDPDKIKAIMDMIETNDDGWMRLRIELGIKK